MLDAFKQTVIFFIKDLRIWILMNTVAVFLLVVNIPWWGFVMMMFLCIATLFVMATLTIYRENQLREEFADRETMRIEDKSQLKKIEVNCTQDELDRLAKLKQLNEQFFEISELTCLNCKSKVKASKCIGPDVHYICSKCSDGFMIDLSELETEDKA